MYASSINIINNMFNFVLNAFLVNNQQLSKIIKYFFFIKNVLKFLSFISIYVLTFLQTTSPNEGLKKLVLYKLGQYIIFSACLVETFGAQHKKTCCLFRIYEPYHVRGNSFSFSQNMPIYYPSRKYKLSIRFFQFEYWYTVNFVPDISCPSKGCLVHDRNVHEIFAVLNPT